MPEVVRLRAADAIEIDTEFECIPFPIHATRCVQQALAAIKKTSQASVVRVDAHACEVCVEGTNEQIQRATHLVREVLKRDRQLQPQQHQQQLPPYDSNQEHSHHPQQQQQQQQQPQQQAHPTRDE